MQRTLLFSGLTLTLGATVSCLDFSSDDEPRYRIDGNGEAGRVTFTLGDGAATAWSSAASVPVRIAMHESKSVCSEGCSSHCSTDTRDVAFELVSLRCEGAGCQLSSSGGNDARLTVLRAGTVKLTADVEVPRSGTYRDTFSVTFEEGRSLTITHDAVGDPGTRFASLVNTPYKWCAGIVGPDGQALGGAVDVTFPSSSGLDLDVSEAAVSDRSTCVEFRASRPGSGRVVVEHGALQREATFDVVSDASVTAIELRPLLPGLLVDAVDVGVTPVDEASPPIQQFAAGWSAELVAVVLRTPGRTALGGVHALTSDPKGVLWITERGPGFARVTRGQPEAGMLRASVGDGVLALPVATRLLPPGIDLGGHAGARAVGVAGAAGVSASAGAAGSAGSPPQ